MPTLKSMLITATSPVSYIVLYCVCYCCYDQVCVVCILCFSQSMKDHCWMLAFIRFFA